MAVKLVEISTDHLGRELPKGVYGCATESGEIVSYKVRWREEDENGVRGQRSKSFSATKLGSFDRALEAALSYAGEVTKIVKARRRRTEGRRRRRPDVDDLFKEWLVGRAANLSPATASTRCAFGIATSPPARSPLCDSTGSRKIRRSVVRFQDALLQEGLATSRRRNILKLLRAVLRWGRRRHPGALTVEFSGVFELPPQRRNRLPYAADAVGVERIIEAILNRPARDDLRPIRDAAFAAAMGFTVSSRPSEWRLSATWGDLHADTVELQRAEPSTIPRTFPG